MRSSNPYPSNSPKPNQGKRTNSKPQRGNKSCPFLKRTSRSNSKCGKNHEGMYLAGIRVCEGCGKSGNQMKDCPIRAAQWREGTQTPTNSPKSVAPITNLFNCPPIPR